MYEVDHVNGLYGCMSTQWVTLQSLPATQTPRESLTTSWPTWWTTSSMTMTSTWTDTWITRNSSAPWDSANSSSSRKRSKCARSENKWVAIIGVNWLAIDSSLGIIGALHAGMALSWLRRWRLSVCWCTQGIPSALQVLAQILSFVIEPRERLRPSCHGAGSYTFRLATAPADISPLTNACLLTSASASACSLCRHPRGEHRRYIWQWRIEKLGGHHS